jgi:alkylated DNA repair dioxygenase AlkB
LTEVPEHIPPGGSAAVNLLPRNGTADFHKEFLSQRDADFYFKSLRTDVQWKQEKIRIFGREIQQPRLTASFADRGVEYSYSGLKLKSSDWTDELLELRRRVKEASGFDFNTALLNLYRDGKDSMGWHRDNEKELGCNPPVASISLGATRQFQLRYHSTKDSLITIELTHGSLLLMSGSTQHYWEHRVPKTNTLVGERINITFRQVLI